MDETLTVHIGGFLIVLTHRPRTPCLDEDYALESVHCVDPKLDIRDLLQPSVVERYHNAAVERLERKSTA